MEDHLDSLTLRIVEQTIVATSIAGIGSALHAKGSLTWITTSYLLSTTVFQPIVGRLAVRVNFFIYLVCIADMILLGCRRGNTVAHHRPLDLHLRESNCGPQ
jgi:MFS family permease